jgi:hypothetical protein
MKYLVVAKPGGEPVPPDKLLDAYKASQAYGNKLKENNSFDCVYAFFEGGGCGIIEADSHDEVYKHMVNFPMFSSFIWEVQPLLDWNKTYDTIIGALK